MSKIFLLVIAITFILLGVVFLIETFDENVGEPTKIHKLTGVLISAISFLIALISFLKSLQF